jgi:ketosteroid isomerase-like protein
MMRIAFSVILIASIYSTALAQSDEALIRKVLEDQVEAWNRGDIEGYMQGYWNSDSTLFSSGGNLIRGHREVLGRYKKRYGTRELMGTLEFTELEVRRLSPTIALAVGVWRLRRANDEPWGRFTLVLEKKPEGWRITADHTSAGE